jgi:1-phosphofructokinase
MRPVITVTLNPAIDRTLWIDHLVAGATHRTTDTRTSIGGKGINVARTVAQSGVPVVALGVAGEDRGTSIEAHLLSLGVQSRFLPTPGETRTNLKLIEFANGRMTEINGSGPVVSPALIAAVETELLSAVKRTGATVVVLAGSLPLGVEASIYAKWTELLRRVEPPVAVLADASGEALELVVPAMPLLVKPNRVEAEALVGRAIEDLEGARLAACEIGRMGPRGVLLSLGAQGSMAQWDGATQWIPADAIESLPGNLLTTVGAGDAMVAGIAIELARRDSSAGLDAIAFFAMCHEAGAQAARQIAASAASADQRLPPAVSAVAADGSAVDPAHGFAEPPERGGGG